MAVGIPMKVKAVIIRKHAVAAFVTKTVVDTYRDNANLIKYELLYYQWRRLSQFENISD